MATIVNLLVGGPTANYPADLTTIPGPWVGADRGALRFGETWYPARDGRR